MNYFHGQNVIYDDNGIEMRTRDLRKPSGSRIRIEEVECLCFEQEMTENE